MKNRGTYIDYEKEMPGPICKQWKEIIELIEEKHYEQEKELAFCHQYIDNLEENATKRLVNLILGELKDEGE